MSYDYTKDDADNGNGNAIDDIEIGGYAAPEAADTIEKENGFRTIPPGEHTLVISYIWVGEKDVNYPVLVNGTLDSFVARPITVTFSLPNDPRANVKDFFVLPPGNPRDMRAYNEGIKPPEKDPKTGLMKPIREGDKGGFQSKKFFHFMDRLGFVDPATNQITPTGRKPSQWKGRAIMATVAKGSGTYTNKAGETVPRDNSLKMFSYRPANAAAMAGRGATPASHAPSHGQPAQQAAPARPAYSTAAVGLDDL